MSDEIKKEVLVEKINQRLQEEDKIKKYNKVLKNTLERIEEKTSKMFTKANDDGSWSKGKMNKYNRLTKLKKQVRTEIRNYRDDFEKKLIDGLADNYKQQSLFTQDYITATTNSSFSKLPTKAVKATIKDLKIKGKTLHEYLMKYGTDFSFNAEQEILTSINLGENPQKTAKRLAEVGDKARHRMEATTRSWANRAHNKASLDTYNQAGISKAEYMATLDSATCPICSAKDGKIYNIENVPTLPQHVNCRCTTAPVVDPDDYDKSKSYEEWLKDGRRSKNQLNKIKARLERYYKNGRIQEKEYSKLKNVLDNVIKQR